MPNQLKLDLTKVPFGRARNGIVVYEENNRDGEGARPGLYFAARIQGGEHRRSGGIVDLVPIYNGEALNYEYVATPELLTLKTEKGSVNILIDGAGTLRIFGEGVGLRLYSKFPFYSMMIASTQPGGLVDLSLSGTTMNGMHLMFKALRGGLTCESVFNVSNNGPDDVTIEMLPTEDNKFEIEAYTMNPNEWGYVEYTTIPEALADVKKDFEGFKALYPEVNEEWTDVRDLSAYAVWIHKESPNAIDLYPTMKADVIYSGRLSNGWANAFEQPLYAMAMNDKDEAIKLIKNMYIHMSDGMLPFTVSTTKVHYQAAPPTQGAAVLELFNKFGDIGKDDAEWLYKAMKENFGWWETTHSFAENHFSYNQRDELSIAGLSYNACDFPLETPDLYTFMILYTKALSKLAAITGECSKCWDSKTEALKQELFGLWNGRSFDLRAVRSGVRYESKSLLVYLPVMLGKELPQDILDAMCADLADEGKFFTHAGFASESRDSKLYDPKADGRGAVVLWLQMLLIGGLFDAEKTELAVTAAKNILVNAKAGCLRDVFAPEGEQVPRRPGGDLNAIAGSALIYIAGKC